MPAAAFPALPSAGFGPPGESGITMGNVGSAAGFGAAGSGAVGAAAAAFAVATLEAAAGAACPAPDALPGSFVASLTVSPAPHRRRPGFGC